MKKSTQNNGSKTIVPPQVLRRLDIEAKEGSSSITKILQLTLKDFENSSTLESIRKSK